MLESSVSLPDGTRLACQVQGTPGAPALLLLPGQSNSHRWWDRLRDPFAHHYRTVTFDYRGTGTTDARTDRQGWSTRSFADDAVAVLDALDVDRAHVYGTSMGGRVAQMMAIHHPTRVSRLVLACTSPGGSHAYERSREVRRRLGHPDPDARRRALLDLMYTPSWARQHGNSSNLLGDPHMSPKAAGLHLQASTKHDAWEGLPLIQAPTFVLHGSDDLMTPAANAALLAARIPGATTRLISGGRHGFFDEMSDVTTREVLGFYADT